jgi:hypothetical protein
MVDRLPPPPSHGGDEALQYSHSGARYLLGYGEAFFGIWDRSDPDRPVERFPRTPEGWDRVWRRFVELEPTPTEVGLASTPVPSWTSVTSEPARAAPSPAPPTGARAGNPANPAWWLLPILMGWMGGVIAWLLIRDQDRGRARAMLITGIVATVF